MRIVQLVPSISYGDGVSNDCIAIKQALLDKGYDTQIYAESISPKLKKGTAVSLSDMPEFEEEDVIIYHLASGHYLGLKLDKLKGKKIVRYHNITPPYFFAGYDRNSQANSSSGYESARYLADKVDYVIAASEYNKQELQKLGYRCDIEVMPVLIPFKNYEQTPDKKILSKYSDGKTNIIFTGRVVPNKKHEDIIQIFSIYKKHYDPDARLFLVGNYNGMERYYERLCEYMKLLGVEDVVFTGHIPFSQILAYYRLAHVFLCASEHEGFGIPLLEAMYFKVPVLAYDSSAVGETLGDSGILLQKKEPKLAAGLINRLVREEDLRSFVIEKQNKRLKNFTYENISRKLYQNIDKIIAESRL